MTATLKLNMNASFIEGRSWIEVDGLIHDDKRKVLCWFANRIDGCFPSEIDELMAIRQGLFPAPNQGLLVTKLKGDAQTAINLLNNQPMQGAAG